MANITFTNTGYTTMFSDGSETITGNQYQTLLKYMKNNSEIYMPQNQKINILLEQSQALMLIQSMKKLIWQQT